jgi:hypothetical protein
MEIQPYTPTFVSNSPQQRQASAAATETPAAFAASLDDKTTISSQVSRDRLAEQPKGNNTYDFTNIAPNDSHIMTLASFMSGKLFQSTH